MIVVRLILVVAIILLANAVPVPGTDTAAAASVSGEAYALAAGTPPRPVSGSPAVSLPPSGGTRADTSPGTGANASNAISASDQLAVTVTGTPTDDGGTVTSTATVGFVELFGGTIRASNVRVVATSTRQGGQVFSIATVTFGSLTVNGRDYSNARPNEWVELPGVGSVVLNEQLVGGDGQTATSIVARALRLQVAVPTVVLGVPEGTEIVVASASAGVPGVGASAPVAAPAAAPTAATGYLPLSTREPIDVSIRDTSDNFGVSFDDNFEDDNDDDGNGNGNDNGGVASTVKRTATQVSGVAPVVVTVVVVVVTPTATPTTRTSTP